MDRIQDDTATDQSRFTEGDPSTGTLATILRALWLNGVQEELIKLLELAGITPDANTWDQVWRSLQVLFVQRLTGTLDGSSTANAHVLNPSPSILQYRQGQVVSYLTTAENTGAVTLNINGKGAKDLLNANGAALEAGELPAGRQVVAVYDDTAFRVVNLATRRQAIISGVANHGDTIPLPDGFTAAQTHTMLSIRSVPDYSENNSDDTLDYFECHMDASRVLTCRSHSRGSGFHDGQAHYLVIGVR